MTGDGLRVRSETTAGEVVLVSVGGVLDGWSGSGELADALTDAAASGCPRTVVDLSGVTFADSAALHALLDGQREHEATGVALVLAGPLDTGVRRLFEVTGTLALFRIADGVESALRC